MPDLADEPASKRARLRGVAGSIWLLEHAQDAVTVAVGVVLIALAAVLVVAALADFVSSTRCCWCSSWWRSRTPWCCHRGHTGWPRSRSSWSGWWL